MSVDESLKMVLMNFNVTQETKGWILELKEKFDCENYRELFLLALRFLDESPYEKLPTEVRATMVLRGDEIPKDPSVLRWIQIERLYKLIETFKINKKSDYGTLTKMITELRLLIKDYTYDEAAKVLEEARELQKK